MTSPELLERLLWGTPSADDLQQLVDEAAPEGFRLEYKREVGNGTKVLESICALANTFGGVIVVGMDESKRQESQGFGMPGPEGLMGVEPNQRSRLAQLCSSKLVFPYDPEIRPVSLPNGKVALLVRVDAAAAPRPLTVDNRVLVRTESGNRPADLFRLRQLFQEAGGQGRRLRLGGAQAWPRDHPTLTGDKRADVLFRAAGAAALVNGPGRAVLSDSARDRAGVALDSSLLNQWLMRMHDDHGAEPGGGVNAWVPRGRNYSHRMEIRWEGFHPERNPFPEAWFVIEWASPTPTAPPPASLTVTMDVVLRLADEAPNEALARRLTLEELYYLFTAGLELFAGPLPDLLESILPRRPGPLVGPTLGIGISGQRSLDAVLTTGGMLPTATTEPLTLGQGGFVFPPTEAPPHGIDAQRMMARDLLVELLTDNGLVGVEAHVDAAAGINRTSAH